MFDSILERVKKLLRSRIIPIYIIYGLLAVILVQTFFRIQIVDQDAGTNSNEVTTTQNLETKSTRGNIYDRNGVLLAYDELCYSITLEDQMTNATAQEKNAMVYRLLTILKQNHCPMDLDFYIARDSEGDYYFTVDGNTLLRFRKDAYSTEELTPEQENATAQEMMDFLRFDTGVNSPKFSIGEEYTPEEALEILTIRFALFEIRYQNTLPNSITIASDVSHEIVAAMKENRAELPGVEVVESSKRIYEDSKYFAHILGYTGQITQDELTSLQEQGDEYYATTDQIGKSGIEQSYEENLRGTKGYRTVEVDSNKTIQSTTKVVEAVAGDDIYLTIDAELQKTLYQLLEREIAGILLSKIHAGTSVGSKGENAANIRIPICEVYFALLDNNVIDVSLFSAEDASSLEKSVQKEFLSKEKKVLSQVNKNLAVDSTATSRELSNTMEDYLEYCYELLETKEILRSDLVDPEDEKVRSYEKGRLSLSAFLQYAISKEWMDLTVLNLDQTFYSNDEVYEKLLGYLTELLQKDTAFAKMIYEDMVYSYDISGRDICLLLYEQGIFSKETDKDYASLKSGAVSAYGFLTKKIKNMELTPDMLALEPCSGSIVATDPETGEVLALVTYPSYDNNKLANTIDAEYYTSLVNNKSLPLLNRATQTRIAPGSTYKMVTGTAALEEGVLSPQDRVVDKGKFTEVSNPPKCWIYPSNHGSVDITKALEVSCNYFFYRMGYELSLKSGEYNDSYGLSRLEKYANLYGFDDVSGVEIAEYNPQISTQDAVRSAIGQGKNAYAPVQMAKYVSTVANTGTCYDLTLISKISAVTGETIYEQSPVLHSEITTKSTTFPLLHRGMELVVSGANSSVDTLFTPLTKAGIQVAGKTGTAQQNTYHPNHAWFVSFAPSDNPEIALVVMLPNGYTSANAAQLASNCYQYYFQLDGVKKILKNKATTPAGGTGRVD